MTDLYDRFGRLVYTIIYHVVHEAAMSEDLSQETFWRIWSRIQTFDPKKGKLKPWVARIARNCAIDYLRSTGRREFSLSSHQRPSFLPVHRPQARSKGKISS